MMILKQFVNPYDYISYSKNYLNDKNNEAYIPEPGSLDYNFGTTDHKCYILDLAERNGIQERLEIQFVPDTISGARTANLKDISIIGRNNPFLHYTGGKELINLPLEFYSDVEAHDDVKKKTSGLWRPTLAGLDFVDNKIMVPSYCKLYNNKEYGFSPETINIIDALGKKFDYNELINGELPK